MLKIENSALVIIDVQGKLAQLVDGKEMLISNLTRLIKGAQLLNIPIVLTEQKPDKLGPTVPELLSFLNKIIPIKKESFSAWGSVGFQKSIIGLGRKQLIITGIETHICVYQTALDLLENGIEIHVLADAVSSRNSLNHKWGLEGIRNQGGEISTTEMALFQWIRTAADPRFKDLAKLVK